MVNGQDDQKRKNNVGNIIMTKGNVLSDSFEQLVELGQSTAKQGAKQVAQTFSPLKMIDNAIKGGEGGLDHRSLDEGGKTAEVKGNKSTPLDLNKLQKKFQDQDKVKLESLRNRLFQIVKREDEKSLERKKAEEEQKKQKEEAEKEQKKRQQLQQQKAQQVKEEPRGKIRRSIFSPKKVAQRSQQEVKPAAGKQ